MNVYEAIRQRRSVRAYRARPVAEKTLARLIEAVRLAPSANNRQPWKFILVTDPDTRRRLAAAARGQDFVGQAPVVVAAVGLDPAREMTCGIPGDPVDLAIALEHLALAAVEEGLGTCWIGAFYQEEVKEILGVPGKMKVVQLMTLGWPADAPVEKKRKEAGEITCRERFS